MMRESRCLLFGAFLVLLGLTPAGAHGRLEHRLLNRLIGAGSAGVDRDGLPFTYAYAPSIVYERGRFHAFFCSNAVAPAKFDTIRYASSWDGRVWSVPAGVLNVSEWSGAERAACDPSLIHYRGYYYLFYSGNRQDVQTVVFVARARHIEGPYAKLAENGRWIPNAPAPRVVVGPRHAVPDCEPGFTGDCFTPEHAAKRCANWYGAGQQTVMVVRGRLVMYYTDDTAASPRPVCHEGGMVRQIFRSETTDPAVWPPGQPVGVAAESVDVKWDGTRRRYQMTYVVAPHTPASALAYRTSRDGWHWSDEARLCDAPCFPDHAHNLGVSGNARGHLIDGRALIAYGAPSEPRTDCGICMLPPPATWDLYGSVQNPAGPTWNDVPWSWVWGGMTAAHRPVIGDYDGDGRADRAIVDTSLGRWYVISSQTGGLGVPGIGWQWRWGGWTSALEPRPGDYDGDGRTDRAVRNPASGEFYVIGSASGTAGLPTLPWGVVTPPGTRHAGVTADFDGDGRPDRAIVDPVTGRWFVFATAPFRVY